MFEVIFGSLLFWPAVLVGLFVLLEIAVVKDSHIGVLWLAIFLGVLAWFGPFNPFVWAWHNIWALVVYSGIYVTIGCLYGFVKWYFHLKNVRDEINLTKWKSNYERDKAATSPFVGTFVDYLVQNNQIPLAKDNKWDISIWMAWWPFSLLHTVFADILRRFWEMLVEHYLVVFDKINNAVFGHLND